MALPTSGSISLTDLKNEYSNLASQLADVLTIVYDEPRSIFSGFATTMDAGEFFSSDRSLQHVSSEFSFCLQQNSDTDEFNVYWGRADNSAPNDAAWATNQLDRLQSLLARKDVLEKKQEIPLMEWVSIWKYHSMLSTALDEMIKAYLSVSSGGEEQDEL